METLSVKCQPPGASNETVYLKVKVEGATIYSQDCQFQRDGLCWRLKNGRTFPRCKFPLDGVLRDIPIGVKASESASTQPVPHG